MRGTVKAFDEGKGYGFIAGEDGREYLVYFTAFVDPTELIHREATVEFTPVETAKGPQAVAVSTIAGELGQDVRS